MRKAAGRELGVLVGLAALVCLSMFLSLAMAPAGTAQENTAQENTFALLAPENGFQTTGNVLSLDWASIRGERPGLHFDGEDDFVRVHSSPDLNVAENNRITITMLAEFTGWVPTATVGVPIDKRTESGTGCANYNWEFNSHSMWYRLGDNTLGSMASVMVPNTLNQLNLYGMTLDGANLVGYLNGDAMSNNGAIGLVPGNDNVDLRIGSMIANPLGPAGQEGSGGHWSQGTIYEVRIYNRPLSPTEMMDLYNGLPVDNTGLMGWWKFDEQSGQVVHDYSGRNNNGTLGLNDNVETYDPAWTGGNFNHYEVWLDGVNVENVAESKSQTPTLADGVHEWYVVAVNNEGNGVRSENTFTFEIGHPEFQVSNLLVTPENIQPGENVTLSVTVTNVGNMGGDNTVRFVIENTPITKSVTLAPGASETVSVIITKQETGTYNVSVGGLSGSFRVVAVSGEGLPVWSIAVVVVIIVIAAVGGFWVRKGKKT